MREATEEDFDWAIDFALELALMSPHFNWQNAVSCTYRLSERPEFGTGKWPIHREESNHRMSELLREVVRNPFRPITIDPRWLTSDVVGLARAIYDDRPFERMPILADALMDAGCEDESIVSHCRGDGPHVRGCWVVDLLLGKE